MMLEKTSISVGLPPSDAMALPAVSGAELFVIVLKRMTAVAPKSLKMAPPLFTAELPDNVLLLITRLAPYVLRIAPPESAAELLAMVVLVMVKSPEYIPFVEIAPPLWAELPEIVHSWMVVSPDCLKMAPPDPA
jgi:hypothetical protein